MAGPAPAGLLISNLVFKNKEVTFVFFFLLKFTTRDSFYRLVPAICQQYINNNPVK
jgi:hypothetical protein